ncbi:unnamed protein product, partial [Protopolystoma xenopodis]
PSFSDLLDTASESRIVAETHLPTPTRISVRQRLGVKRDWLLPSDELEVPLDRIRSRDYREPGERGHQRVYQDSGDRSYQCGYQESDNTLMASVAAAAAAEREAAAAAREDAERVVEAVLAQSARQAPIAASSRSRDRRRRRRDRRGRAPRGTASTTTAIASKNRQTGNISRIRDEIEEKASDDNCRDLEYTDASTSERVEGRRQITLDVRHLNACDGTFIQVERETCENDGRMNTCLNRDEKNVDYSNQANVGGSTCKRN